MLPAFSRTVGSAAFFAATITSSATAQPIPTYGLDFVTVGAAGNRGTRPDERPWAFDSTESFGAVAHEFAITRTEVLTEDWYDFVVGYAPFRTGAPNSSSFTSLYIGRDGLGGYEFDPANALNPVEVSWENAARYCNWLHNGKVNEAWAFESGAYDTATFTRNGAFYNHQQQASPGALFRLPTYDELIKAFYFDPDRYGDGEAGYWLFPQSSNNVPISGLPENGGTTNTGVFPWNDRSGQYPFAATPWGLLDASGGTQEFTETSDSIQGTKIRINSSSSMEAFWISTYDRIDSEIFYVPPVSVGGFRIVHGVPSPYSSCALLLFVFKRRGR